MPGTLWQRFNIPYLRRTNIISKCSQQIIIILEIQAEAVDLIATGKAPRIVQPEEGASYDKIWKKKSVAEVLPYFLL